MFQDPQTRQVNQPKMFRKKSISDELFLHFFCKSSESYRVFNYLHDSNSIFRAGGINSENIRARTVLLKTHSLRYLGFWLNLILSMLTGCLSSLGLVILWLRWISSWTLWVIFCLRSRFWVFLVLRVGICRRLQGLKSLVLGVWMGGLRTSLRHTRCPGFLVWLFC